MTTELDFGIKDPQLDAFAALECFKEDEDVPDINDGEIVNPLFIPLTGSKVSKMSPRDIYAYDNALALCHKDHVNVTSEDSLLASTRVVNIDKFRKLCEKFELVRVPTKVVMNASHKNVTTVVSKEILETIGFNVTNLNNNELVTCMPQISKANVNLYVNMYDNKMSLDNIRELTLMSEYFNCRKYTPSREGLASIFARIRESDHFMNEDNCSISTTSQFMKRRFQYKEVPNSCITASTDIDIDGSDKLAAMLNKLSRSPEGIDYLRFMSSNTKYIDGSSVNANSRRYFVDYTVPLVFDEDTIVNWLDGISDTRTKFNLFVTLLYSKDYCHLVVNNKRVLFTMNDIIAKCMPFMRIPFGYAWLHLYLQESIKGSNLKITDRCIFDINTAHALPKWVSCIEDPHMNPYNSMLVAKSVIDLQNNLTSTPMDLNHHGYGVTDLNGFKKRLNVFTTGNSENDIFEGFSFQDNNMVVTGSAIPACCMEESPLMQVVSTGDDLSFDTRYKRFFAEYYTGDCDIAVKTQSMYEFMDNVHNLTQTIESNLRKFTGNSELSVDIESENSILVLVTKEYIKNFMKDVNYDSGDIEKFVLENIGSNEVREHLYTIYQSQKIKRNRIKRKKMKAGGVNNPLYEQYHNLVEMNRMKIIVVNSDIRNVDLNHDNVTQYKFNDLVKKWDSFYDVDEDIEVPEEVDEENNNVVLQISESIKFKINSPNMVRPFEVFKIKNDDFFGCISRFHLSCVRGMYNGDNVYLTPSCITALMTGLVMDCKYFSCSRDPIETILKYFGRNFTIPLNDFEKMHYVDYNGNIDKHGGMFKINAKDKTSIKSAFRPRDLNDNIFRPLKAIKDFPNEAYNNVNTTYIRTMSDLIDAYRVLYSYDASHSGINFLKFKTIKDDGTVEPIKPWILEAAYSEFFSD